MQDFWSKVYCTYCQEDISGVRIQCCECIDFDICLLCFSAGAEIGFHRNDHPYKLFSHGAINIFASEGSWSNKEELQLLDAMEIYGFGNWQLISNHVATRTAEECKEEYTSRYMEGNIGKAIWSQVNYKSNLIDHTSDIMLQTLPVPVQCSPEEATLLSYKPYRDEFKEEFDREAEQLVSRLQVDLHDSNMFTLLNLGITDLYIRRLKERFKRKRLARDYKLISKYCENVRNSTELTPFNTIARTLSDQMIIYAQFLPAKVFERLVASLEREKELRQRLSELIKYRNLGFMTQEEIIHCEQLRKKDISETSFIEEYNYKNGYEEMDISSVEQRPGLLFEEEAETKPNNDNSSFAVNSDLKEQNDLVPFGHLLSEHELKFCLSLNLNTLHYITLKSLIIQDNLLSSGKYIKNSTESQELSVKNEIIKYLAHSGWLPSITN